MAIIFNSSQYDRLPRRRTSFAGTDIRAIVHRPTYLTDTAEDISYPNSAAMFHELGSIQTISISNYRDKREVRALGHQHAVGYARGCIAEGEIIETESGPKKVEDVEVGDRILSFNERKKEIEFCECINKFVNGVQPVYQVTLQSGISMKLTENHRVLTAEGWKTVSELSKDDILLKPSKWDTINGLAVEDDYLKLLAYGIGDGVFGLYMDGKEYRFTLTPGVDDKAILKDIEEICKRQKINYRKYFRNNCYQIVLNACIGGPTWYQNREYHKFYSWTKSLGIYGLKSHEKYIPEEVVSGIDNNQISLFLNRLFGTDGYVSLRETKNQTSVRIGYTSTSEKLIKQVQRLLLRLGIDSRIYYTPVSKLTGTFEHKHAVYTLKIPQYYVWKFLNNVGLFGKEDRYEEYIESEYLRQPVDPNDILNYCKENEIPIKPNFLPRCNLWSLKHTRKNVLLKTLKDVLDEDLFIEITNNIVLKTDKPIIEDRIKNVELVGNVDTYDLEVNSNHNLFGSFLSHNSRTIGGTLIFALLDTHPFNDDGEGIGGNIGNGILRGSSGSIDVNALDPELGPDGSPIESLPNNEVNIFRRHQYDFTWDSQVFGELMYADELPPFDIIITFVNEAGAVGKLVLYGIEIIHEGQTLSIQDLFTEVTYSYTARGMKVFQEGSYRGRLWSGGQSALENDYALQAINVNNRIQ